MPLEKLNAALIGAIQNSTPEYTNAAAILTDKLNIGREAAYRRLRGEVPFTFGEAGVLSAQMNFSLDRTVGALDFGNVLFRLSFSDYHTALEDYTGVIDQDTLFYREVSSDVDAEQAIAGNSFPRMLYMRYPKPTNFKLFKWLYQQGLIDCSGAKFEDMKVPEVLLQSYRDLVHEAQLMPATTLIFDGSCTKRWVNAICAFRNMHLIRDESVEVLKAELLQMLDDLEEICVSGQFRSGRPVSVFISDMDIEATYCYLSAWHYRGVLDQLAAQLRSGHVRAHQTLGAGPESVCDIDIVQRGVAADSFLQAAASCRGRIGKGGLRTLPRSLPGINGTLRLVPWCLSCASNPDGFSTCVTFAGVARPLHNPT